MVLCWIAIIAVILSVAILFGGRDCQVPTSGPLSVVMKGQVWVATGSHHWRSPPCRRIR